MVKIKAEGDILGSSNVKEERFNWWAIALVTLITLARIGHVSI